MIYTNDLAVTPGTPGLMIVPFPNPTGASVFGIIDARATEPIRTTLRAKCLAHELVHYEAYKKEGSSGRGSVAKVHEVGNYKISMVANASQLMESIDWRKFNVPPDFAMRLSVVNAASIVPATCGFVVAEAIVSVKNDGFAILYPGLHAWFPTCHEASSTSTTQAYDVRLYSCIVAPENSLQFPETHLPSLRRIATKPLTLAVETGSLSLMGMPLQAVASDGSSRLSLRWGDIEQVTFAHLKGLSPLNANTGFIDEGAIALKTQTFLQKWFGPAALPPLPQGLLPTTQATVGNGAYGVLLRVQVEEVIRAGVLFTPVGRFDDVACANCTRMIGRRSCIVFNKVRLCLHCVNTFQREPSLEQ